MRNSAAKGHNSRTHPAEFLSNAFDPASPCLLQYPVNANVAGSHQGADSDEDQIDWNEPPAPSFDGERGDAASRQRQEDAHSRVYDGGSHQPFVDSHVPQRPINLTATAASFRLETPKPVGWRRRPASPRAQASSAHYEQAKWFVQSHYVCLTSVAHADQS
jgi:hypothetical protein